MKKEIAFLALMATLGYACDKGNPKSSSVTSEGCSVKNLLSQEETSYDELVNQLLKLVQHDWEFIIGLHEDKNYSSVGILIPETDATDDRISGKGDFENSYSPESISPEEGYMIIRHSLCQSPKLIINGVNLTGNLEKCASNPSCLDGLVQHIKGIDRRNGNTFFADQVGYYANAVEKRYDHGIKRKTN